jgi:hypothetical protein
MIPNGKGEFDQDELSWWAIILEWTMSTFFKVQWMAMCKGLGLRMWQQHPKEIDIWRHNVTLRWLMKLFELIFINYTTNDQIFNLH